MRESVGLCVCDKKEKVRLCVCSYMSRVNEHNMSTKNGWWGQKSKDMKNVTKTDFIYGNLLLITFFRVNNLHIFN